MKLGVNIDHVATLRNARGENDPSILELAFEAQRAYADSITIHLREDRRHILDDDIFELKKHLKISLNLEMALTEEMLDIAIKLKPKTVCFVPEKREEVTTEGGLDVFSCEKILVDFIKELNTAQIDSFVFVEPSQEVVQLCSQLGARGVELHTGSYAHSFNSRNRNSIELNRLKDVSEKANKLNLEVHAGHGLNYHNVQSLLEISEITELNIGHAIIAKALQIGLFDAVRMMKTIIGD